MYIMVPIEYTEYGTCSFCVVNWEIRPWLPQPNNGNNLYSKSLDNHIMHTHSCNKLHQKFFASGQFLYQTQRPWRTLRSFHNENKARVQYMSWSQWYSPFLATCT